MSPEVITVEEVLGSLGTRVRHLEALEIKLPVFDARAFGARGDGSDDTDAIQLAANAAYAAGASGGTVFLADPPGGHYLMNQLHDGAYPGALRWPPNVDILGTGYNCQLRATGNYAIITRLPGVELHCQSIRGLRLFYEGTHSMPGWTNANAIWLSGAPDCNHLLFENIWIDDAYCGFYDDSIAWGNVFINVVTNGCRYGFRKIATGTGYTYINCFAKGTGGAHYSGVHWDLRGWSFEAEVVGLSMIDCAMDDYYGNRLATFVDQEGLNIIGFDYELNRATNPGGAADLFYFQNCKGVVQGCHPGLSNYLGELVGEAGTGNLVYIFGGRMAFDACDFGPGDVSRKLGNVYTIHIESAAVSLRTMEATNIPGSGVPLGIGITSAAGTAELTVDRVAYNLITNPNNNIVLVTDEISVGVANSGGAGFRLLRVPNAPDTRSGPLP